MADGGEGTIAPGDMLCFQVYAASHAFTRFYADRLAGLGVTYPQLLVVMALADAGPMPVGRLSATLGLEPHTLSPLLKRMEAAGLVERRRDPDDERRVQVTLGEAGRETARGGAEAGRAATEATGLTAAEVEETIARLAAIRAALGERT